MNETVGAIIALACIPLGLWCLVIGVRNSIRYHTRELGDALLRELDKRR